MANTFEDYTVSTSTTDFNITFEYLEDSHVVVEIDGVLQATSAYSIIAGSPNLVRLNTPATTGMKVRVRRDSNADSDNPFVDFVNGSVLTESELDKAYRHNLFLNEEIGNLNERSLQKEVGGNNWDTKNLRLVNVADPVGAQDATTKNYVDTADALKVTKAGDTMSGVLAMGANKITGVADPTLAQDAATKTYVDTADALKVTKAGDTMSGPLAMGANKITGVADPTLVQDAATKTYVDTQIVNTVSGSSTESVKTTFAGDGSTAFTFGSGISLDGDTMYEVAIDGVLQEPSVAYVINADANTITFTSTPPTGSNIVVVQRGYAIPVTTGTVSTSQLENSAVDSNKLASNSVTTAKILDGNITTAKILDANITTAKIADGNITAAKLDSSAKDRSIHTGTQAASTISDFDTEVSNNTSVAANTAKVTNATHTGDVTGSTALTIANNAVTGAKISSTDTEFNVNTNVGIGAVASGTYKLEVVGDMAAAGAGNKKVISHSTDSLGYLEMHSGGQAVDQKTCRLVPFAGKLQLSWVADNGGAGVVVQMDQATGNWEPNADNAQDLGSASKRWDDVYSTGGINGSDRNLKEDIQDLDEAEKRVAVACKSLVKKYRLKSAVEKKGDDARTHVGVIAQELQAAFEAEGLDPFKYSMVCRDTWYEKEIDGSVDVKNVPTEGYQEVTQMSVRYTELLAFIISAL